MLTRPEMLDEDEEVLSYSTLTDTDSFFAVPITSTVELPLPVPELFPLPEPLLPEPDPLLPLPLLFPFPELLPPPETTVFPAFLPLAGSEPNISCPFS